MELQNTKKPDYDAVRNFERKALPAEIPSGLYFAARLDGKGFSRLTAETLKLKKPFDLRFRELMVETVLAVLESGFKSVAFAYQESDEFSLLFRPSSQEFSRRPEKLLSLLAAEASSFLSLKLGLCVAFDCRLRIFSSEQEIFDYFDWRLQDSYRNALSAYCYWIKREEGLAPAEVHRQLFEMRQAQQKIFLQNLGVEVEKIPDWQKFGTLFHWETRKVQGFNPLLKIQTESVRRKFCPSDAQGSNHLRAMLKETLEECE